jgi:hypothetical protein
MKNFFKLLLVAALTVVALAASATKPLMATNACQLCQEYGAGDCFDCCRCAGGTVQYCAQC